MPSAVRIAPRRETLDSAIGAVELAQIQLGGVPRGAALVLCASDQSDDDAAHLLNELAAHGYEGTAATIPEGHDANARLDLVRKVLDRLDDRGWRPAQIALIGYQSGAALAMRASAGWGLGAVVSVSPTGMTDNAERLDPGSAAVAGHIDTPWLCLTGEHDPGATPGALTSLAGLLRDRAPAFTEIVRYAGVGADFYGRSTESIELAASFDYWQRVIEWLDARVEPRPTPLAEAWTRRRTTEPDRQSNEDTHTGVLSTEEGAG